MCKRCWYAVAALFPEESEQKRVDILWNHTAFPMASYETVEQQLEELSNRNPNQTGCLPGEISGR